MMMELGAEGARWLRHFRRVTCKRGRYRQGDVDYDDPSLLQKFRVGLEAMVGINVDDLPVDHRLG